MSEESYLEFLKRTDRKLYNNILISAKSVRMDPNDYLVEVIEYLPEDLAMKLKQRDPSLISKKEIELLEKIVASSRRIRDHIANYHAIVGLDPDEETQKHVLSNLARIIYQELSEEYQKQYGEDRLMYLLPRLNIGPTTVRPPLLNSEGKPTLEFIVQNLGLIGEKRKAIAKLLARSYYHAVSSKETSLDEIEKNYLSYVEKIKGET